MSDERLRAWLRFQVTADVDALTGRRCAGKTLHQPTRSSLVTLNPKRKVSPIPNSKDLENDVKTMKPGLQYPKR